MVNVVPTEAGFDARAHTRQLERSARSALEFTAFGIAITEGVLKPCTDTSHLYTWSRDRANLSVGFTRLGFQRNALLARAVERRALALRHTNMSYNTSLCCVVEGGGAIVSAAAGGGRLGPLFPHPASRQARSRREAAATDHQPLARCERPARHGLRGAHARLGFRGPTRVRQWKLGGPHGRVPRARVLVRQDA